MDRCGIFVDAGHLLAEGGKLTCGTGNRSQLACSYAGVVQALRVHAEVHSGLKLLRVYWYDGAKDAIPTADHLIIGGLPMVKLRLGRISHGEQKGVDSLIVRDFMTLARERAISTAYLLAGDEDLREGVAAAQDMGVQVVLLGIPSSPMKWNQAGTLVRESDEHIVLGKDFWEPHFSSVKVAAAPIVTGIHVPAASFARDWVTKASIEEKTLLIRQKPRIPMEIDVQLITAAEEVVGSLRGRDDQKQLLRFAFWEEICK